MTTLARRIRRIGLLPTTYKTVDTPTLVEIKYKDGHTKTVEKIITTQEPVRRKMRLSYNDRDIMEQDLRDLFREKRLDRKNREKAARRERRLQQRLRQAVKGPKVAGVSNKQVEKALRKAAKDATR